MGTLTSCCVTAITGHITKAWFPDDDELQPTWRLCHRWVAATGHTPTPSRFRATFTGGEGGDWV